jgi:hypothetical protein
MAPPMMEQIGDQSASRNFEQKPRLEDRTRASLSKARFSH